MLMASYTYDTTGDLVEAADREVFLFATHMTATVSLKLPILKVVSYFLVYDASWTGIVRWRSDGGRLRSFDAIPVSGRVEMTDSRGYRWLYELDEQIACLDG